MQIIGKELPGMMIRESIVAHIYSRSGSAVCLYTLITSVSCSLETPPTAILAVLAEMEDEGILPGLREVIHQRLQLAENADCCCVECSLYRTLANGCPEYFEEMDE